MNFDQKLNELNLSLPDAKSPVGNYVATKVTGKLLFVSGQISINEKVVHLLIRIVYLYGRIL